MIKLKYKSFKVLGTVVFAFALMAANSASAALTMAALTITSDGALTLNGAASGAITVGGATTTGNITIGGALTTGTLTLGKSDQTGVVVVHGSVDGANTLFNNTTTGTIAIGVANTGGITIGNGATIKTITIGGGNAVNTIKIGDHATPANVITIGGAASGTTIAGTLATSGLVTTNGGLTAGAVNAVTGADTLTSADCGRITTVTAGIDTAQIVLPEASTVIGCTFTIIYIGADGGALLDISPLDSDADGIDGTCTLAASVVTLSGTADADIGFTKATIQTGDTMKLTAVGAAQWIMHGVSGICANN